jgi:hypothetical protein
MADYRTIGKDQLERENLASQSARDIFALSSRPGGGSGGKSGSNRLKQASL